MTLAELIARLDEHAEDLAIYAAPRWRPSSPALAVREPDDGSSPPDTQGKTFFLTVRKAKQLIAMRRATTIAPTHDDLVRAVIYGAIYDEAEPLPSLAPAEIKLQFAV